jgi:hypothetical protein
MLGLDIAQVDPYEEALEEALDTLVPFVLDGAVNELSADRDNEAGTHLSLSRPFLTTRVHGYIVRVPLTLGLRAIRFSLYASQESSITLHLLSPQVVCASVCARLQFPLAY